MAAPQRGRAAPARRDAVRERTEDEPDGGRDERHSQLVREEQRASATKHRAAEVAVRVIRAVEQRRLRRHPDRQAAERRTRMLQRGRTHERRGMSEPDGDGGDAQME